MTMTAAVRVDGLRVRRGGAEILHGVDATIPTGSITGLLGPSGSGKTTVLRCLVGVQIVAAGSVDVLGLPAGDPALRTRVGYVTQSPAVYSDLTVSENLRYFAAVLDAHKADVDRVLDSVGLHDVRSHVVGRLPAVSRRASRWPRHCSVRLSCWCSTNRQSASIPCCAATFGTYLSNSRATASA